MLAATGAFWVPTHAVDVIGAEDPARTSELIALQNDDGGWPWVGGGEGRLATGSPRLGWSGPQRPSPGPCPTPRAGQGDESLDAGVRAGRGRRPRRPGRLAHALETRKQASFEAANALNRVRNDLPDVMLAYLALTSPRLDRPSLADEVLGVLAPRAWAEAVEAGRPAACPSGTRPQPWHGGAGRDDRAGGSGFRRVRPRRLAWKAGSTGCWPTGSAPGCSLRAKAGPGRSVGLYSRAQGVRTATGSWLPSTIKRFTRPTSPAPPSATIPVPRRVLKIGTRTSPV
ncbi:MAG: hypothetical protein WKF75_04290 [Singulisphaera sp.]